MKKITSIIFIFLILSATVISAQSNTTETLKQFVKDIPALASEKISSVEGLSEAAKKTATKTIEITKENIAEALKEAVGYKTSMIVVESHTIVKFSDVKKCTSSGSWGACMPYGEGFIQNGGLTPMTDYINNIIGRPDTQKRTLFLFK